MLMEQGKLIASLNRSSLCCFPEKEITQWQRYRYKILALADKWLVKRKTCSALRWLLWSPLDRAKCFISSYSSGHNEQTFCRCCCQFFSDFSLHNAFAFEEECVLISHFLSGLQAFLPVSSSLGPFGETESSVSPTVHRSLSRNNL